EVKMGNGLDEGIFLGPVIREEHKQRTLQYIESGEKEGAQLIRDGRKDQSDQAGGYFVGPTIFDQVTSEMTIWQDVIFAPVLSISRVKNFEEAIALTNQSRFANGACIFANDGGDVRTLREMIDAGMLGVKIGVHASMALFLFRGWKDSFCGDLHTNGKDGLEFYTRKKVVTGRWV